MAILASSGSEFLGVYLAGARIGAGTVTLNPERNREEIGYIIDHSGSVVLVLGRGSRRE